MKLRPAAALVAVALSASWCAAQTTRPAEPQRDPRLVGENDRALLVTPALANGRNAAGPLALTFNVVDQVEGDATTMYLQGFEYVGRIADRVFADEGIDGDYPLDERIDEADVSDAAAERVADEVGDWLPLVELAVQRSDVKFEFPIREQGYMALLPHLNPARQTARVLAIRGNHRGRSGDFNGALEDARVIFKIGTDVAAHDEAVVVEGMVGNDIHKIGLEVLVALESVRGMPNVYWSLLSLELPDRSPRWIKAEQLWMPVSFPMLDKPASLDAEGFAEFQRVLEAITPAPTSPPSKLDQLAADALREDAAERMLPEARQYLVGKGHLTQDQVDALDRYPTLGLYLARSYDDLWREIFKLASLPPRLVESQARGLYDRIEAGEFGGTLIQLVQGYGSARTSVASVERLRRLLVTVEALRDHAARHGKFPDDLADVELYLPPDPLTGEPFGYERDGDTAVLIADDWRGDGRTGFTWYVDLRRP